MKSLIKITTLVLLSILVTGCVHHSGFYSGYSGGGSYGFSVSHYEPYRSYPVYRDYDVHVHDYVGHKHKRKYKSDRRYDHRYGGPNRRKREYRKSHRSGKVYRHKHERYAYDRDRR